MKALRTIFAGGAALALALALFSVAAPALAATNTAPWTEGECKTVSGNWQNNDCYALQKPSKLNIQVGGLSQATLSQYLGAAFNLAIGIAAVLSVIFIMIGGFRYLTAAGGGAIEPAKSMIKNSLVGLVLALLSYTLLQTVNPRLLSLELPPVKLVKSVYLSQLAAASGDIGGPCYTIKDKEACANACIKKGLTDTVCECKVINEGIWSTFAKASTYGATLALGGGATSLKAATGAAQTVWGTTLNLAMRLVSYAKNNPLTAIKGATTLTTAGVMTAAGYSILPATPDAGELGVCLPSSLKSVPPGGTCFIEAGEQNCVTGSRCVKINDNPPYGMCVSGDEGSACTTSEGDSVHGTCNQVGSVVLSCCTVSYGLGTCQKSCSNLPLGAPCASNDVCASRLCALGSGGSNVCSSGSSGSICANNSQCTGGKYCPTPFYNLGVGGSGVRDYEVCADRQGPGEVCCDNAECKNGTCAGKTDTGACYVNAQGECPGCGNCN
jgi:hypothetical protein